MLAQIAPGAAVAVIIMEAASGFFPSIPLLSVLTPLRLLMLCGFAGLIVEGARLNAFRTHLDIPIAALVVAATAATFIAGGTASPLRGFLTQVAAFYLVVGFRRRQPESWRAIAVLALVGVSIAGTVALAQAANGTPTGFCRSGLLGDADCAPGLLVRSTGTFANPNTLAAFLLLLAPVSTLAIRLIADRTTQRVVTALVVIGFGSVVTSFSRGGYIAAAAGLLVLLLAHRLSRSHLRVATIVAVSVLVGGTLLIAISSSAGDALGVRGQAWAAAIDVTLAHPLGVGLHRAGAVIQARAPGDVEFSHVHNMWLNWMVETGVLGLLAITAITVIGALCAARLARTDSPTGATTLAGLVAFYLMSLLDHPANLDRVAIAFWLILGLAMAETSPYWRQPESEPVPEEPVLDPEPELAQTVVRRPATAQASARLAPGRPRNPPSRRIPIPSHSIGKPDSASEPLRAEQLPQPRAAHDAARKKPTNPRYRDEQLFRQRGG